MRRTGPELQDRSLQLRGLVQVMAVDGVLDASQRGRIHTCASVWDFNAAYVDAAIDSVLENVHFPMTPPLFNSKATAEAFLREAVHVALCDGEFHSREREWLMAAAQLNGVDSDALFQAIEVASPPAGPRSA